MCGSASVCVRLYVRRMGVLVEKRVGDSVCEKKKNTKKLVELSNLII